MTFMTASDVVTIPLSQYPGFNRFSLDLLNGNPAAVALSNRREFHATGNRRSRDPKLIAALASSNLGWGNDVTEELQRWSSGETLTIIAGQQVGFAGGPLYTLAKIASMLALRETFRKEGREATVFFWMATEDHDFSEVSRLLLQTRNGLRKIEAKERSHRRTPVGRLLTPASLLKQWREVSQADHLWADESLTMGESFARLMSETLNGRGVILVDALLPELRASGKTLLQKVASSIEEVERIVDQRSERIQSAGYAVPITRGEEHYSLLYLIDDKGERQAVTTANASEFISAADEHPERCSTAALIRPLLQDAVFGTDVFVGGPAEVAYYSQILPLHERFGIEAPHVAVRGHALVAPARILETIARDGLDAADVFLPLDQLTERHEATPLSELEQRLEATWKSMKDSFDEGTQGILQADPTLRRSLDRSTHRMRSEMNRVIRRGRTAVARRDRERFLRLQKLHEVLYPTGSPQDRVAGWITWWEQYGAHLVDRLVEHCKADQAVCKVVSL